ncbi:hypothetical protein K469DRAFT_687786 [Zopfia rhizophila CBS 207.26]|uniref:Uncharacterized protein n=1 Tax=Zopfia rhizophila CBS 207.26 TaxID=1314779 RepID=A0A6A6E2I8_9PEZI|nr:hypothetical protein K469DRAFT_687786 [Zopfia rhizophila CBS 207.26]
MSRNAVGKYWLPNVLAGVSPGSARKKPTIPVELPGANLLREYLPLTRQSASPVKIGEARQRRRERKTGPNVAKNNGGHLQNTLRVSKFSLRVEVLTYLPLAIVQAAAYINKNVISLADYLSLLAEQEQDVINLLSKEFKDDGRYRNIKNLVATTWLISFNQVQRRD